MDATGRIGAQSDSKGTSMPEELSVTDRCGAAVLVSALILRRGGGSEPHIHTFRRLLAALATIAGGHVSPYAANT